jgi:prepilin-type N-terminal cleavage/methylation domain-containing protein
MLMRRGMSLVELLVALTLAAIVLGAATTSLLRQQRTHLVIRSAASADLQRRAALGVLASQLAGLDAAAGDLVTGQITDTAIQVRAPVAASIACATGIGSTLFATETDGSAAITGASSPPAAGDSLWWRGDSVWIGREIAATSNGSIPCTLAGMGGSALQVYINERDTIQANVPLRVTRQTRYALYRSGDGTWQLGSREWSAATNVFAAPQPFAGPFIQKIAGRKTGFRYFDDAGVELTGTSGPIDATRIVRIRITAHSLLDFHERGQDSVRSDSVDVPLARPHAP